MQIIIVGCGKVGTALTQRLSKEDNDICIIDMKPRVVHELASECDVMGMVGNGASYSVLLEAGIENTDLLIAVTESDEMNLLCCVIARKASKCHTIARVRNPIYSAEKGFLQQELGLSMILNPEHTAAAEISRLLCFPGALAIDSFGGGKMEMIRFKLPQDNMLEGIALKDVSGMMKCEFLICAVERNGEAMIPGGNFSFQAGDVISMASSRENAARFFKKMDMPIYGAKDTMIIGGGKIAVYLARMLLKLGISVKIIETDENRCEELCELLPDATIIHGDGSDERVLIEERIEAADSFVALTNMDEENILLSLFAKKKVHRKVVTKINRSQLTEVIHSLDLDSVVYPKALTAQKILQYVRAMKNSIGSNVKTLYRLYDDKVEALEFNIQEDSDLTNTPLCELRLIPNLLVCGITRGNKVIIPNGQSIIQKGDTMIVVTTQLGLQDAQDILRD